jgi:hypothetical protein
MLINLIFVKIVKKIDKNMTHININDILLKHSILFDYDTKDSFGYMFPHYLFEVKNSIHYKTLINNDFNLYNKLITTTNQLEHSETIFKDLIKNFNINRLENEKIILQWLPEINKYVVNDGCHRVSLLLYNNITEINKKYIKTI